MDKEDIGGIQINNSVGFKGNYSNNSDEMLKIGISDSIGSQIYTNMRNQTLKNDIPDNL